MFRALCLAENACFVGAQMEGVSTGTLETIEGWETFTRLVAIVPLIGEAVTRAENGNLTPWQALERGVVAPAAAFNRYLVVCILMNNGYCDKLEVNKILTENPHIKPANWPGENPPIASDFKDAPPKLQEELIDSQLKEWAQLQL